jgi:DNA-binding SARP family transcriptional activator
VGDYRCRVVDGWRTVIEFRVLGPLQVVDEARVLPLGGLKQRAVLALLLLERNRVVPRDRLVNALWGDSPPASAANSVQVYISKLRRLLDGAEGESVLVTAPPGYRLHVPAGALDADEFEQLVNDAKTALSAASFAEAETLIAGALSLWRGPALADLASEHFARAEIARLEGLRLEALEARFEAMLSLGREREAVGELHALVALHPLDERLRAQLMVALYRSGRHSEALETYRAFRQLLDDELGLEPNPELRRLEQAILRQDESLGRVARLAPAAASNVEATEVAEPTVVPAPRRVEDERRPVTVLFADIVGSTALGERLEPDEAKVLVGECVTMMSRAVDEYGGTVQAYQGDGICAYFGVPSAHEDDPERAARAALRILEVVGGYARDIDAAWGISGFAVRIGVNSGPAAVGLVGTTEPQTVALGDATNVAARLQAAAEPGTILVGHVSARRLQDRFELGTSIEIPVKGREEPVRASRLVRAKEREPRAATTSLIGREREIDVLKRLLGDLGIGRGRVVLLTGAPGIGKTRLLTELATESAGSVTWLEGACHSYGGLPGWPFVEILLGWLGAEIGEPEIAIRTKARAAIGALFGDEVEEVLAPLAGLLRLRLETQPATEESSEAAFVRWLERLSTARPVVVAIEDTHWADASTRRLAEHVLALADRAPVGLVLTEEPIRGSEGAALRSRALADFGHRTLELSLAPLADDAAEEVLAGIVGEELDAATRAGLIREAEGNPLYLEELARAFLEGALEPRGRTWTVSIGSLELLPPSLENLLVARIDRQADEPRRLAQVAAAIGRRFPVPVLERVQGADVHEPLRALLQAEIVREVSRYPELECTFTHGLLREAALSTLTSTRKRSLYADIAAAFESIYAGSLEEHLEQLAHYHAQAGNLPKALEYAERARAALTEGP